MEDKIFDLMTKMYSEFSEFRKESNDRFDKIDKRLDTVEKTIIKIENVHGEKLSALFDGYVQNTNKLDKIEEEVKKHDEVIEGLSKRF